MSAVRELLTNKENESPRVKQKITQKKNENSQKFISFTKTEAVISNYPSDEPEILEVEFITLLVTLTISFVICAALTYSLVWVSSIMRRTKLVRPMFQVRPAGVILRFNSVGDGQV